MTVSIPLSNLVQRPTEVAAVVQNEDVILGRRNAIDLFLSTRERREREAEGLRITAATLAVVARVRPDLAEQAMVETLSWMGWLPAVDRAMCLQELVSDLRSSADTGQILPFATSLAAWRSTAISYQDPEVFARLRGDLHEGDTQSISIANPAA
jgi:hypothetical protein